MTKRTIKFRAKTAGRIKNNKWLYFGLGDVLPLLIDKTIGQNTGFLDKSGREIWEGDIIKRLRSKRFGKAVKDEIAIIIFEVGAFFWKRANGSRMDLLCSEILTTWNVRNEPKEFIEVIGNIFDNPELLNNAKL